jgi:hypothetical protein
MASNPETFIGIDPSGGRSPFTYAALDRERRLLALGAGELEDVLAFAGGQAAVLAAVNAPAGPNLGLVRKKLERQAPGPGHSRGLEMRLAEYLLRERGIGVSPTPSRRELCPAWMQMGFALYQQLGKMGYKPYPSVSAPRQWLETHPHAAFCALLGRMPLPKPTLEGRLQRQLALHAAGVGIKDPMDFFEEITRHKILGGNLPMEFIYLPEELDALAAALVACLAGEEGEQIELVGSKEEGRIAVPVSAPFVLASPPPAI